MWKVIKNNSFLKKALNFVFFQTKYENNKLDVRILECQVLFYTHFSRQKIQTSSKMIDTDKLT